MKTPSAYSILLAATLLTACAPQIEVRGHVIEQETLKNLKEGVDNKTSVEESFGTPSTAATFDADIWYYISTTQSRRAFLDPVLQERTIVAVEFDKDGNLAATRRYSLKDGRTVAWASRETPTKGRELTFLEQMFGNFGRFTNQSGGSDGPGGGGRGGGRR